MGPKSKLLNHADLVAIKPLIAAMAANDNLFISLISDAIEAQSGALILQGQTYFYRNSVATET